MKITFLGTGTSHGVPSIDCVINEYRDCPKGVCLESFTDPKHSRMRCSLLVEYDSKHILFDVSPDFREQAIANRIPKIDAVFLTHMHADHIMGIPDIRSYTRMRDHALDFYGSAETMESIRNQFDYIFNPATVIGGGIPRINLNTIERDIKIFGLSVTPVPVTHGGCNECFGYRIGTVAYIPDMKSITSESLGRLKDLDCLILNCLRDKREHPTHLILNQSIELAREIKPRKCYFVHMAHDIHYKNDAHVLDSWMSFAWDGLTISDC